MFLCTRSGWNGEEDKKGKGCMLQFQHAMVRVLTHFVAEPEDPRDPKAYFLGSDWQVDVTRLVKYFMKVEDPRVARLQAGRVLSGRDLGTTSIQVTTNLQSDSDRTLAYLILLFYRCFLHFLIQSWLKQQSGFWMTK